MKCHRSAKGFCRAISLHVPRAVSAHVNPEAHLRGGNSNKTTPEKDLSAGHRGIWWITNSSPTLRTAEKAISFPETLAPKESPLMKKKLLCACSILVAVVNTSPLAMGSPFITSQPESLTVLAGQTAAFAVTATGTLPLNYQWRFNGFAVSNGSNSNYAIIDSQTNHVGIYDVVISDVSGSVTSSVVSLSVVPYPAQPPENFYVIKARMELDFELFKIVNGEASLYEEGSGYGRFQAWLSTWEPVVYPHGDMMLARDALNDFIRLRTEQSTNRSLTSAAKCAEWIELGPKQQPTERISGQLGGVGRLQFITFDPQNQNNMFVGSPYGGLYRSTDGGDNWINAGTDFLPRLGVAHCAVDPNDSATWFLAMGDGEGLDGPGEQESIGIYRTTDAGTTYDQIGSAAQLNGSWWGWQIKKLLLDPNDANIVYAATDRGIYKSFNALAANPGAVTWLLLPTGASVWNNNPYYDIEFKPGDPSVVYASGKYVNGQAIIWSQDSGATWAPMPNTGFLTPTVQRVAMEVSPANPDLIYAVVVYPTASPASTARVYRYDLAPQTWTDKGPVSSTGSYGTPFGVHWSRAQSIGVSPVNPDLLFIGDVKTARAFGGLNNAFCTWAMVANSSQVHDDVHSVKFSPDGNTVWAATDGGLWKSPNLGVNWTAQNNGMGVSTSWRMSGSATDPNKVLIGAFDLGTTLYEAGSWFHVYPGDGLQPMIDYLDPLNMFASAQGNIWGRSANMGLTFPFGASAPLTAPCRQWSSYSILNSANPQVFYQTGCDVWRTTSRGASGSWSAISDFSFGGLGLCNYFVYKIYTAPSNPNYLYAHVITTPSTACGSLPEAHYIYKTTDANNSVPANILWTVAPHPLNLWISDIDVDEQNPDKYWLVYGGAPATAKVWAYDGNAWANLTANFPPGLPIYSVLHPRGSDDGLFVGTRSGGVYCRDTQTGDWSPFVNAVPDTGLPNINVAELEINYVANKLRVGTYGRGLWESTLNGCLAPAAGPDAFIKDSDDDVGNEPNNESGTVLWASPAIWIRNSADFRFTSAPLPPRYSHEHQHQNPEYSPIPANTPWIYTKVLNRGSQPVSGQVHLYWANASLGLNWQGDWTEIVPLNPADTTVTGLQPGGAWVVGLQWTDIPDPALSTGGHFCLLARFVADVSTPDPITGEVLNNGIWDNVYHANNTAWKNVTVVNLSQNLGVPGDDGMVNVHNIFAHSAITKLTFDVPASEGSNSFFNFGTIRVDLGAVLFQKWTDGGNAGNGVVAVGQNVVQIAGPGSWLGNINLAPNETQTITFQTTLVNAPPANGPNAFSVHLAQYALVEGMDKVIGGETFQIKIGSSSVPAAITSQPQNQTVTLGSNVTFSVTATNAVPVAYQWRRNGVDLLHQTNSTLTISPAQLANAGEYTVKVSNEKWAAISSPVKLTVNVREPIIRDVTFSGSTFTFTFKTEVGANYIVEYKTSLDASNWVPGQNIPGTGAVVTVQDNIGSNAVRFFRVRLE